MNNTTTLNAASANMSTTGFTRTDSSKAGLPPEVTLVRGTVLSAQSRTSFETKQMPAYAVGSRIEPGEIYMEAVDTKEFWLQGDDGREQMIKAEGLAVNARAGHRLAVAMIPDVKGDPSVLAMANLNTGEYKAEPVFLVAKRTTYAKLVFNSVFSTIFGALFLVLFVATWISMGSMLGALMFAGLIVIFPLALCANLSFALAAKSRAKALAPEMEQLKAAMLTA